MDYQNRRFSNRTMYRQPGCGMNQRQSESGCGMNQRQPESGCSMSPEMMPTMPSLRNHPFPVPVGMGYVPMQNFENIYPRERGFQRGTIFADLDLPFLMTPCEKGGCR